MRCSIACGAAPWTAPTPARWRERLDDLERFGIPRRELENALERHRAGADDALREILEKLARIERARKEDEELRNAREQVRRAQDESGRCARAGPRVNRAGWPTWTGGRRRGSRRPGATYSADAKDAPRERASPARPRAAASQGGSGIATDRQDSPFSPGCRASPSACSTPQGQAREGEEHTSQGRILPRSGRPRVENVEMSAEFATQVEEVLSREHYPAHYKEFVRRYFLNLSQGARPAPEQPSAREEAP